MSRHVCLAAFTECVLLVQFSRQEPLLGFLLSVGVAVAETLC